MIKRRVRKQIGNLTPDQIGNLTFDRKPFENMGQMNSYWGLIYIVEKIFLKAIRYCHHIFKIDFI